MNAFCGMSTLPNWRMQATKERRVARQCREGLPKALYFKVLESGCARAVRKGAHLRGRIRRRDRLPVSRLEQSQVSAVLSEGVRETVDLYLDGKIERWYSLQGKPGVAFIINVTDPAVAHEMLEKLPLGKAHMMSFELIPLGPLNPLRFFARHASLRLHHDAEGIRTRWPCGIGQARSRLVRSWRVPSGRRASILARLAFRIEGSRSQTVVALVFDGSHDVADGGNAELELWNRLNIGAGDSFWSRGSV
jgi:hypothetical protein